MVTWQMDTLLSGWKWCFNQNFGENKNGVWIPKRYLDSDFGNHGFRLQYKNTSVGSGSSSVIGADTSGKDNHFTSVVLQLTIVQYA